MSLGESGWLFKKFFIAWSSNIFWSYRFISSLIIFIFISCIIFIIGSDILIIINFLVYLDILWLLLSCRWWIRHVGLFNLIKGSDHASQLLLIQLLNLLVLAYWILLILWVFLLIVILLLYIYFILFIYFYFLLIHLDGLMFFLIISF